MAAMGQNLGLQMATRQQMALTPQMIQSMELLQIPLLELEQRLTQEMLANPALELAELNSPLDDDEENSAAPAANDPPNSADEIDYDWDNVYDASRHNRGDNDDERFDALSVAPAREISLDEHLLQQLGLLKLDERLRALCEAIVASLDRNGYFKENLNDIVAQLTPPPDAQERGWALQAVQSLNPAGIAATSPAQCLLLQLRALPERTSLVSLAEIIVKDYLEDLASNRLPKIAAAVKRPVMEINDAVKIIQKLNPYPGENFSRRRAIMARPEVFIRLVRAEKNEQINTQKIAFARQEKWRQLKLALANSQVDERKVREAELAYLDAQTAVNLFDEDEMKWEINAAVGVQPEVSEMFLALYDNSGRGKALRESYARDPEKQREFQDLRQRLRLSGKTQDFREKYFNANNIVRAVRQREITIVRLTREMVARQKDYLSGRTPTPAPLMMKDLAEKLAMDNGTVSRAVDNKFADTPIGMRPLRELFTRAVTTLETPKNLASNAPDENRANSNGENIEIGNVQIRNRIREMLAAENKKQPLKDDVIEKMLAAEGINIKRRTVAKYRMMLGFKNYSQRREY